MTDCLQVDEVVVAFGGNTALRGASLQASTGTVTGLIGPNGAGKTTLFNVCSGLIAPDSGSVTLLGNDVTRMSAARRARLGLGRTFQRVQVAEVLTVRENVLVAAEARAAGANVLRQVIPSRSSNDLERATDAALTRCGIADLASRSISSLSTGQRRLVELARVIAGGFRLLLLDEPSSGLDDTETGRLGEILAQLVRDTGVGVLLVEHDMNLVMSHCDHIFVLEFGTVIYDGSPTEVRRSPEVRQAYLGAEATA